VGKDEPWLTYKVREGARKGWREERRLSYKGSEGMGGA